MSNADPNRPRPLTREQVGAAPVEVIEVEIPRLGTVCIKAMSGAEREAVEAAVNGDFKASPRAVVAAACLSDPSGVPLFGAGRDGIEEVNRLDSRVLDAIFRAALDHNGMGEAQHEDVAKN